MATWLSAQQRRTIATFAGSFGIGSATTIGIGSLDLCTAIRVIGASSGPTAAVYSFSVTFQQAVTSGTWLTREVTTVSTAVGYEFTAIGREGLITITNAASTAYIQGAVYALVV